MTPANVKGVPAQPGTSLLRFFDHRPDVVEANHRRLFGDPTVGKMIKGALRSMIVNNPSTFERERPLTLEDVRREGREEERRADRETLLAEARERLSPEQVAELEAIEDFGSLVTRYSDLLSGPR